MVDFIEMAIVRANGEGVPIMFLVGKDGFAIVFAFQLSLRFQLNEDSLHIDEEVFNDHSRALTYTIGQVLASDGANRV